MIKKILGLTIIFGLLLVALPTLAASTPSAAQVACVASAVNVREASIDSSISTYTQAINTAYTTRAAALQQAYSQNPGQGVIKKAVKAAWSTFASTMKSARNNWKTSKKSAWSTFKSAVKTCKATGVTTDTNNASLEAVGN